VFRNYSRVLVFKRIHSYIIFIPLFLKESTEFYSLLEIITLRIENRNIFTNAKGGKIKIKNKYFIVITFIIFIYHLSACSDSKLK